MIDAHVHLVTAEMVRDATNRFDADYPAFSETVLAGSNHPFSSGLVDYIAKTPLEEIAKRWIAAMDEHGIEKAVFFPVSERQEQLGEFIRLAPERFIGYAFLDDPLSINAPDRLRKYVKEMGFKGLKLYPSIQFFHAYDSAVFPLYEEAQSLGVPITFHMGITHAPASDYRYTNPLDIQLPLKLFPKLNFIIAHFGAGFFREVCLLAFHAPNLYLDSSGTNNWREYTPANMALKEIFRTALRVFGPENIIFGTDTVMRPDSGYREAIMREQKEIINSVANSKSEARLIMRDNALRLYC